MRRFSWNFHSFLSPRPGDGNFLRRKNLRSLLSAFGVGLLLVSAAPVWGFSFGDISINSNFGERFNAELDLILDKESQVAVAIGSEEDYRRLELERPKIIDDLLIEKTVQVSGGHKIVRLVSKRPLFYPSFNLVVRGTQDGGTVIENYLITVDFRQSLALNVKGRKNKPAPPRPADEPVDLLQGGEARPETASGGATPENETPEATAAAPSAGTLDSLEASPVLVPAAPNNAKTPSTLKGAREPEPPIQTARWVRRRVPPPLPPMEPQETVDEEPVQLAENPEPLEEEEETPAESEPQPPAVASEEEPAAVSAEGESEGVATGVQQADYGPLEQGENLFSVAKSLGVQRGEANRFVVAVWLDNPDSFIFGNMNGLREGARLDLAKLEERLAEVDPAQARDLLQSQWEEWKVIRQRLSGEPNADEGLLGSDSQENRLPSENARDKQRIFEMLREWKTTWEARDQEGHLAHYSPKILSGPETGFGDIRAVKKRMFQRHQNVQIRAHRAVLVLKSGRPMVSFNQSFSSDKMESFGRKDIELEWENSEWKILNEKFKVKEYQEKPGFVPFAQMKATPASLQEVEAIYVKPRPQDAPFVIHASSHMDFHMATRAINEFRNQGFNAYSSPVYIARNRKIFRVYVGRFFDEVLAREITKELKKLPMARHAVSVRYPHTLLAGEYDSEEAAQQKIDALRSVGLSPFLFTTSDDDFSQTRFRVLLGAFAQEKDAGRLSRDLKANGIEFSLMAP